MCTHTPPQTPARTPNPALHTGKAHRSPDTARAHTNPTLDTTRDLSTHAAHLYTPGTHGTLPNPHTHTHGPAPGGLRPHAQGPAARTERPSRRSSPAAPLAGARDSNPAARPLRQWERRTRAPRPISARRWGGGGGARATGRPAARACRRPGGVAALGRLPAGFARGTAPCRPQGRAGKMAAGPGSECEAAREMRRGASGGGAGEEKGQGNGPRRAER